MRLARDRAAAYTVDASGELRRLDSRWTLGSFADPQAFAPAERARAAQRQRTLRGLVFPAAGAAPAGPAAEAGARAYSGSEQRTLVSLLVLLFGGPGRLRFADAAEAETEIREALLRFLANPRE
jgi:hypothetical protein